MKKNLVTVVTLALVLVNLVLTGLLVFLILPEARQANALIEKVATAIDLDLSSGQAGTGDSSVSLKDTETYTYDNSMTINLADSSDGSEHYAVLTPVLLINKKSKDYKTYGGAEGFGSYAGVASDIIQSVVSQHTMEDMKDNLSSIEDEIVEQLKTKFGNDYIVEVAFSAATYQ